MGGLSLVATPATHPDVALPAVSPATAPPSPDSALTAPAAASGAFAEAVAGALDDARIRLERAGAAERAFVQGRGSLQSMVLERAQADVALSLAAAAASRVAQSLSTILGMQV